MRPTRANPAFRVPARGRSPGGFQPMVSSSAASIAEEERLDAELRAAGIAPADFREPDLRAPLDVALVIDAVPPHHTAKGMFFEQLAPMARRYGVSCDGRYVTFRDYPLRDYMRLIADYGAARYPG